MTPAGKNKQTIIDRIARIENDLTISKTGEICKCGSIGCYDCDLENRCVVGYDEIEKQFRRWLEEHLIVI